MSYKIMYWFDLKSNQRTPYDEEVSTKKELDAVREQLEKEHGVEVGLIYVKIDKITTKL